MRNRRKIWTKQFLVFLFIGCWSISVRKWKVKWDEWLILNKDDKSVNNGLGRREVGEGNECCVRRRRTKWWRQRQQPCLCGGNHQTPGLGFNLSLRWRDWWQWKHLAMVREAEIWIGFGGRRGEVRTMDLSALSLKRRRLRSASTGAILFRGVSRPWRGRPPTEPARLIVNLRLDNVTALSAWTSKETGPRSVCFCFVKQRF